MGEATHGTREFFQFKHRVFEFFVEELGFTAIAIEASFPDAADVNAYVLGGDGDAAKLVHGMRFWTWDTEEVLALVEWMRQHNLKPTTPRKIKFYGFDMQYPEPALAKALDYLRVRDASLSQEHGAARTLVREVYKCAETLTNIATFKRVFDRQTLEGAEIALQNLIRCLESNRSRFAQSSGDEAWRYARQNAQVALQWVALYQDLFENVSPERIDIVFQAKRDEAMARNVEWALAEEGPESRVMLWAHNGHINHGTGGVRCLGWHLRRSLGAGYFAVGFSFNQGSFQAKQAPLPGRKLGLKIFHVGAAPKDSVDEVLSRIGPPILVVDLRAASSDAAAAPWLQSTNRLRTIGSHFDPALETLPEEQWWLVLPDAFDALVYFRNTTAARALPGAEKK